VILAWLSGPQKLAFINGTGPSPKLATPEFYRKRFGGIPLDGPFSTNVPGSVAAFDLALKRYGTKGYSALLADAIEAAEKGHAMTHFAAQNHASALDLLRRYPSSVQVLLKNGRPFEPGDLFVQPDLARTLKTIAREGADVSYRGRLAEMTVATYRKYEGLLRLDDLAAFHAEEAEPVRTDYKGYTIYEAGANSQGLVLLLALNIMKDLDLKALGYNSPEYLHVLIEALKLAFADRDQYISDPRFRSIPSAGLLSAEYAAARRKLIRSDHAIRGTAPPGDPIRGRAILEGRAISYEDRPQPVTLASTSAVDHGETSSFSIADRFGNVVSVTHSVKCDVRRRDRRRGRRIRTQQPATLLQPGTRRCERARSRQAHHAHDLPGTGIERRQTRDGVEHARWRQSGTGDAAGLSQRGGVWDERAASAGTAHSDHDEFPPHDVSSSAGRQVSDPEVTCGSGWSCACGQGTQGAGQRFAAAVFSTDCGSRRGEDDRH
jgi:hypothetical protein